MPIRSTSRKKVYKFVHRRDEYLITSIQGINYLDPHGWFEICEDGTIHIYGSKDKGYAWDGCTPKWEFLDFTMGTPDGRLDYFTQEPITYYASMVHDIIYQFKDKMDISRKSADLLFYKILKEAGFIWAPIYYCAVRFFGLFFGKWKSKHTPRNIRILKCSWIERAFEDMKRLETENINNLKAEEVKQHPYYQIGQKY